MQFYKYIKSVSLLVCIILASIALTACGTSDDEDEKTSEEEQVFIDYGDAESFENALNEGEDLEGKIVQFTVFELHPQSAKGYNIWAGEHLNFISSRNPKVKEGETITVRANTIESEMGSWFIYYDKVENAEINKKTIFMDDDSESESKNESKVDSVKEEKTNTEETKDSDVIEDDSINTESEINDEEENVNEGANDTYESNKLYDIVDSAIINSGYGYTHIIYKVTAKKTTSAEMSMIVYNEEGDVVGKSSDQINLIKGNNNFFLLSVSGDITDCTFDIKYSEKSSYRQSDIVSVEMEKYNVSGYDIYITFKQVAEDIDTFSRFKILYYKDGKIVDSNSGYFSVYAENLDGVDSTDVAQLFVTNKDFDEIEYIFEP